MKKRVVNKQKIFIFVSILFIVGCIFFYGFRFIYYYKKFNKKSNTGETLDLLYTKVIKSNETVTSGDGLYSVGNEYIFKGANVNNYVLYSGMKWRIIKLNIDGSVYAVSENSVNDLMWGTEKSNYKTSQVRKWLNNIGDNTGAFYKNLRNNAEMLAPVTMCLDTVSSISNFKCSEKIINDFVGLLSVSDYTMTMVNDATFLNNNSEFWLVSMLDSDKAWMIKNGNFSNDDITDSYGIRPTITLSNTVAYYKGSGTLEDPYIIEDGDSLDVGEYVKLGDDIWVVYESLDSNVRLALNGYYSDGSITAPFGTKSSYDNTKSGEIGYWLNNDYYNSLSYKNLIVSNDWYNGQYKGDITDVYSSKVKSYVGMLGINDIKLNLENSNYYLMTEGRENKVFAYDLSGYLYESTFSQNRKVRPAITIKNSGIKSGSGTLEDPYILEG